eukprot:5377029-Lingulodinium_polyedra.AAC.1
MERPTPNSQTGAPARHAGRGKSGPSWPANAGEKYGHARPCPPPVRTPGVAPQAATEITGPLAR